MRAASHRVETNGTIDPPQLRWDFGLICVSPKAGADLVLRQARN